MQLFLTSSPCDDDVPAGVCLPCIFFEKNAFVENLRARVPQVFRLAVVAADPENDELNDEMTQTFAACFAYHGMEPASVALCDARSAYRAAEIIADSDLVLLGGGHVPTQHAFFEEIGLRELLRAYSGVVMGISAGSMNCASTVYAQPEMPGEADDPDYERFLHGLELSDIMVLPHYQKVKDYMLDGRRLYEDITFGDSFGRAFLAIPDGSYVLEEDGQAWLFGEGYCIAEGQIEQICAEGESVAL